METELANTLFLAGMYGFLGAVFAIIDIVFFSDPNRFRGNIAEVIIVFLVDVVFWWVFLLSVLVGAWTDKEK